MQFLPSNLSSRVAIGLTTLALGAVGGLVAGCGDSKPAADDTATLATQATTDTMPTDTVDADTIATVPTLGATVRTPATGTQPATGGTAAPSTTTTKAPSPGGVAAPEDGGGTGTTTTSSQDPDCRAGTGPGQPDPQCEPVSGPDAQEQDGN